MFNEFGKFLATGIEFIAQNKVARGMILQAARDIWVTKNCKSKGFIEIKFASEGDDLRVLEEDTYLPGGNFRVINLDNQDQIESVNCIDLDDTFEYDF